MLYRRKLDLDIAELRPELNTLRSACHELRSSNKFKHVLQVEDLISYLVVEIDLTCQRRLFSRLAIH